MEIRKGQPTDAEAIAEIHTTSRRVAMPWLPELHTDAETREWVATVVLPNQDVWVADAGGEVVGYATVEGDELNDLYVHPGWQGQGIGASLLDKAKAISPGRLELWAFQRNADARRFYERHGFVAVRFTDGKDNEEREPDVRYQWVAEESS